MDTLVEKISIHLGTVTTDGDPKSWWADRRLRNNEIIELQQFWIRNFFFEKLLLFFRCFLRYDILRSFGHWLTQIRVKHLVLDPTTFGFYTFI